MENWSLQVPVCFGYYETLRTLSLILFPRDIWWRRQWHPTPVLLPGKSHGWRNLVGCSPWGRKESDMTERLHFHFSVSCIGEGNGNPLQRSCLENPRDEGAWWAAVYGVAQSRTRLKWLSSSSRDIWQQTKQTEVLSYFLVRTMRSHFKKDWLCNSAMNLTSSKAMKNSYRKDV